MNRRCTSQSVSTGFGQYCCVNQRDGRDHIRIGYEGDSSIREAVAIVEETIEKPTVDYQEGSERTRLVPAINLMASGCDNHPRDV